MHFLTIFGLTASNHQLPSSQTKPLAGTRTFFGGCFGGLPNSETMTEKITSHIPRAQETNKLNAARTGVGNAILSKKISVLVVIVTTYERDRHMLQPVSMGLPRKWRQISRSIGYLFTKRMPGSGHPRSQNRRVLVLSLVSK